MQPLLDVGRLRLLSEVELRGSIAAAARAVGLTSSAVSQQLAILEREAGTPLLDRSPRGVLLTGAGQALVQRARAVFGLLEQARAELDRLTGELAGTVRVGTVASAAVGLVSDAACRLTAEHAELELTVTVAEPAESIGHLLDGDLDVAVVDVYDGVPVPFPEHLAVTELATEPLVVVTAPTAFSDKAKLSLRDLAGQPWVMPPLAAACGQAVRFACRAEGFEPRVRWETDDMLLLVRAVAAGHGVAVLPRLAVVDGVAEVAVRPLSLPSMGRRLLALTRTSSQDRPVVRAVLTELVKAAG
ncbi:MAG TPA: LysR family transcriptional regulator [Jatrophihabitans sp.]|nr:LysR family transcriptional regulator [Jatrophihabitans sp.]